MANAWHPPADAVAGSVVYVDANGQFTTTGGTMILILPTTNPGVVGALWNNAGTITISAG